MRDTVRDPAVSATGSPLRARAPAPGYAATIEAARARMAAAARSGDALAVEAAGRAYAGAVNRALLAGFIRLLRDLLRSTRQDMRARRATPVRMVDFEP